MTNQATNFITPKKKTSFFFQESLIPQTHVASELCYEVVSMAKKLKVNTMYSIGAALRQPTPYEPKVFAATTSTKLLNRLKKEKI